MQDRFVISITIIIVIGGMTAAIFQMLDHNNRVIERTTSIDIPDYEETLGEWTKYDGSQTCPGLVEQRFDANKSHYICMYHR